MSLPKALASNSLPVENKKLFVPDLKEVISVLEAGLKKNFAEVSVELKPCPDLTQEPFHLAGQGLSGSPRLLDIGGPPNLVPLVKRDRLYDMKDYPKLASLSDRNGFMIGAGAAPWTFLERNAEMIPNLLVKPDGSVIQKTHISRTFDSDGSYKQIALPQEETKMSVLGNIFMSEGKPGQVLEIKCKKRIGEENFVTCMRKILLGRYPEESVGMGGVFLIKEGKIKTHVMPDFSACPLNSDEEVDKWLKFYEMSAPFVALSTFCSRDPGLDLRIEHTHGFSQHGDAGHYHKDTTPDTVEYLAYYNFAEYMYRIDRPKETHQIGRD